MKILISGLTACGKSYQAKLLAKKLGYKYINASDVILDLLKISENDQRHFWIKEENIKRVEVLRKTFNLDKKVDDALLKLAGESENIVLDTRTIPWLYKGNDVLRIYLNPSLDDRSKIAYGSKVEKEFSINELKDRINEKDQRDISMFKHLYGIDITETKGFDLILDNGKKSPEQTHLELMMFVRKKALEKSKAGKITEFNII